MSKFLITRPEQATLLADRFKMKLIEAFAIKPITTKQVADKLGEKAPRLYRHVDALVEAGLLVLVEEKPKRGTVERYYQSVATRFEVDPDLFMTDPEVESETLKMVKGLLRETESDILSVADKLDFRTCDEVLSPIIMRLAISANREQLMSLREKLMEWVSECESLADSEAEAESGAKEGDLAFRGLVAFYPCED